MDRHQQLNSIVNRLVSSSDADDVKQVYKDWADTYNADLDSFGYVAPRIGVEILHQKILDKQCLIHDAGCGTGLVGVLLNHLKFNNIHGSDFSADMLDKAALTGHYSKLLSLDFSEPLELPTNHYGAIISIGVYSNRFNDYFLNEMVRTLQPSGHLVFSCREHYFDEVMESVSSLLKSSTIVSSAVHFDDYMTGQDASAYYFDLVKTPN